MGGVRWMNETPSFHNNRYSLQQYTDYVTMASLENTLKIRAETKIKYKGKQTRDGSTV